MNVNETLKTMFSDLLPVAADTYKGQSDGIHRFQLYGYPGRFRGR